MFTSPAKIAFSIFGYQVYWYGICMFLAILLGIVSILIIAKRYYKEFNEDFILDLSFVLVLFGILGARIYYVLLDWNYYSLHPNEICMIWNGGLSIHGALVSATVAGFLFAKSKAVNFLRLADLVTYGLVVGQVIGRWGNFFNSEAYGFPCNLPWKLYIPVSSRPLDYLAYDYFHPTFLYESLLSLCLFCFLFFVLRKIKGIKAGTIFLSYLILYSIIRLFVESFRIDSVLSFGVVHVAHFASLLILLISIVALKIIYTKHSDVVTK